MKTRVSRLPAVKAKPLMLLTLFSVFALAAAGCGGGSSKATSATSSTTSTTTGSAPAATGAAGFAAYTQCLTSHGIPASALPGRNRGAGAGAGGTATTAAGATGGTRPTPSLPPGVTQAQYQAAIQACRSTLPAGGFGGFGGGNPAQLAAYRNCLQLHGVTLPARGAGQPPASNQTTTSAAGTTPRAGGFGGLNTSDPAVQAALAACASLRPTPTTSTTAG